MTLSIPRVRHYLQQWELEKLFIEELGWDRHSGQLAVQVDGQTYALRAFAEKRGVQVFVCQPDTTGQIPDRSIRGKIEKQVTRSAYEHLIIFVNAARTTQFWQWVARQPGQPAAYREHSYHPQHHSGDALIQKLQALTIPLNEEDAIDLTGTVHKLRDAFDRDRVTKKFYERFKQEHAAFLDFIKGITEQGDREWYASLMLNRMMFVYFIQRKEFLDGDRNYLKNRLRAVQQRQGKGKFLSFYRYFLVCLFHEGLSKQPAQRALSPDLVALLGDVPYLNGGLFELHALEQKYQEVDIPDEAFEKLFAFFDQYEWHSIRAPCAMIAKSILTCLGTSSRSTSTRNRWGPTIPRRISPNTSARTRSSPTYLMLQRSNVLLPFDPIRHYGGCSRMIPTVISTLRCARALSMSMAKCCPCLQQSPEVSMMSVNVIAGIARLLSSMPSPQKPGANTSPIGSAVWSCATSSRLAQCTGSMT